MYVEIITDTEVRIGGSPEHFIPVYGNIFVRHDLKDPPSPVELHWKL